VHVHLLTRLSCFQKMLAERHNRKDHYGQLYTRFPFLHLAAVKPAMAETGMYVPTCGHSSTQVTTRY
jgi:hypothetical protein